MKKLTAVRRPTCATCRFLDEEACHRRAPQVTVLIVPQPAGIMSNGQPRLEPMPIAAFPPIGSPNITWCGEHETFEISEDSL